jgi:hypothetical protein
MEEKGSVENKNALFRIYYIFTEAGADDNILYYCGCGTLTCGAAVTSAAGCGSS